ncbi:leucine-rich repeat receptor-like serine/threonine-protein kinase BAM1 [Cryptomeria japonica]|uniref:leucine-rich repeat receptor-like serine/threonine-protein kinase BAM1 n=1 Tax=Cryptomeria japonica TaxID=3369 RepID=UPI0027DAA25D|nr:leucine-rich repeat receptor-like serine/threonine-protein kinase BAM1 [Cryptomeria japonica]
MSHPCIHLISLSVVSVFPYLPICCSTPQVMSNFRLSKNSVHGEIPPSNANFSELQTLALNDNDLIGDIPPFRSPMGLSSSLSRIDLSFNNLKGSIPYNIGRPSFLKYLVLHDNQVSGDISSSLRHLSVLKQLELYNDNMLSRLIPRGKQFSIFDASSFLGNPKLRGPSLKNRTQITGKGERGKDVELNSTGVADIDKMD